MTIFQIPNLSLIIAIIGWIIEETTRGVFHSIGATIFTIAIIIWSYQEVSTGVNWFRKILGVVVLLLVAWSLVNQLQ